MATDAESGRTLTRPFGGEAEIEPQRLRLRLFLWFLRNLPAQISWRLAFLRANLYWPRVGNPRTLNEKMLWRILNDRRPELAIRCDKLASKELVRALSPEIRIPEVLWKGTDIRELASVELPDHWVLKPNNSTGLVHIGHGRLSHEQAEDLAGATEGWLGNGPFEPKASWRRKWGYREAEACFFVEEFISEGLRPASDIKVHVFGGKPSHIRLLSDRYGSSSGGYLDAQWKPLEMWDSHQERPEAVEPPELADRILEEAVRLANGFDYLRVDFFAEQGEIWFGEFGAYAGSAMLRISPRAADRRLGDLWHLPEV